MGRSDDCFPLAGGGRTARLGETRTQWQGGRLIRCCGGGTERDHHR